LCFGIIFHLLKSGMEGLFDFNRYIFYGLLHHSQQVNSIALKIIQEIYTR
jgi:hypothetical protein